MTPRRIEIEIGALVVDDPALAHTDVAAALERELAQLLRVGSLPRAPRTGGGSRHPRSLSSGESQAPLPAIAQEIYGRLAR